MSEAVYSKWTKASLISLLLSHNIHPPAPSVENTLAALPSKFKSYLSRHIALKICYIGWKYHGFAFQNDTVPTVEKCLFDALRKSFLAVNINEANYTRCGRTDKGVSGFGQVVAVTLKSKLSAEQLNDIEALNNESLELPYAAMINQHLPDDIKIIGWSHVSPSFNARFDCAFRHYKYYFSPNHYGLNVEAMTDAAKRLEGEHDFFNFCRKDPSNNVTHYMRRILSANIEKCDDKGRMYCFDVKGTAFLYNQVRCMISVLFLVGQGKEQPSVIESLFDTQRFKEKPAYPVASELPLLFYDCGYNPPLRFFYNKEKFGIIKSQFQEMLSEHELRSQMFKAVRHCLDDAVDDVEIEELNRRKRREPSKYTPIVNRK